MRDPNRIDLILEKVKKIWKQHPDLRLAQLLINVASPNTLYYIEDEQYVNALSQLYKVDLSDVKVEEVKKEEILIQKVKTSVTSETKRKERVDNNNRIYIHNEEGKVKAIFEPDLQQYLDSGWKLGRKNK